MPSVYQLRVFVEVVRFGSVRAAAERLVVSQPAVSAALSALQRKVGVPLFERDGRRLRLTAAGTCLDSYARRILALRSEALEQTKAAAKARAGSLHLAAVTTAGEEVLPKLLRHFRARNPDIDAYLEVGNRARIWELLGHWEIELAIAGRPPPDRPFRTLATRPNELLVVGSADEPSPRSQEFSLEALAAQTWLVREPGSGTRLATDELFALLDLEPPRLTIGSNGAIREGARCGLGLALLAREAVARDLEHGLLRIIPTPLTPLLRPWHVVAHAERELTPVGEQFVDFLCTEGDFVRSRPEMHKVTLMNVRKSST
jgi:DNA-binding transcriptional LysR family regulator